MTISKVDFEIGYKKLEAAFGVSINKRRLDAYFEELEQDLNEISWSNIVHKAVRTSSAFPKLSEILEMIGPRPSGKRTKPGDEFLDDDCKVVECIGGVISYENAGYVTVARCPRCDRGPGGIPRYRGSVTLRTEEEMIERRQEREERVREQRMGRSAFNAEVEVF